MTASSLERIAFHGRRRVVEDDRTVLARRCERSRVLRSPAPLRPEPCPERRSDDASNDPEGPFVHACASCTVGFAIRVPAAGQPGTARPLQNAPT